MQNKWLKYTFTKIAHLYSRGVSFLFFCMIFAKALIYVYQINSLLLLMVSSWYQSSGSCCIWICSYYRTILNIHFINLSLFFPTAIGTHQQTQTAKFLKEFQLCVMLLKDFGAVSSYICPLLNPKAKQMPVLLNSDGLTILSCMKERLDI